MRINLDIATFSIERTMRRLYAIAATLIWPLVILLFLQWPLRNWGGFYGQEANDLGQIVFAFFVAFAIPAASDARRHLTVNATAVSFNAHFGRRWVEWACVAPWALLSIWKASPEVLSAVMTQEHFPESFNSGYFLVRFAVILLAWLLLLQSCRTLLKTARGKP